MANIDQAMLNSFQDFLRDNPDERGEPVDAGDIPSAEGRVPVDAKKLQEYSAFVRRDRLAGMDAERAAALRASILEATRTDPDLAAKAAALSEGTRLSHGVVERNYDRLLRERKEQELWEAARNSPALASFWIDPKHANRTSDDAKGLVEIERTFLQGIHEPIRRGLSRAERSWAWLFDSSGVTAGLKRQQAETRMLAGLEPLSDGVETAVQLAQRQRNIGRFPVPDNILEGMSAISNAPTLREAVSAAAANPRAVLEVTLESLGTSAPALVGAIAGGILAGPYGTAVGAGLGSFSVEYTNTVQEVMEESGHDPSDPNAVRRALANPELMAEAKKKGVLRGVPIAAFDALTAGTAGILLRGASPTVLSAGSRVFGEAGMQAAGGAAGEASAQLAVGLGTGEWEYRPGDILLEAIAEIPTAIAEVPGNVRYSRAKANNRILEQVANAVQAKNVADALDAVVDLVGSSKTAKRDPQAIDSFVEQVAGGTQFYVDGEVLFQYGLAEPLIAALPQLAEQLEVARETGGDVPIRASDLVKAEMMNPALRSLNDHIKTSPDDMSRAESIAYQESGHAELVQTEVERAVAEMEQQTAADASRETVAADIKGKLDKAGRFAPQANEKYAALVAAMYDTHARTLGITAEQAYQQNPLNVRSGDIAAKSLAQRPRVTLEEATQNWHRSIINARNKPHSHVPTLDTPSLLGDLGMPNKLVFSRDSMFHAAGHADLPARIGFDLPRLLSDPLFVHPHANGWRVITDAVTENGEPIAVAVNKDGTIPTITPVHNHDGASGLERVYDAVYRHSGERGVKVYARNAEALAIARASAAPRQVRHNSAGSKTGVRASVFHRDHLVKKYGEGFYQVGEAVQQPMSLVDKVKSFFSGESVQRGSFQPESLTITLGKNANLSTFLHETGHFFLEMNTRLATQLAAQGELTPMQQRLLADNRVLLDWFGVQDLNTWNALSLEEQRAHHERFARAFEQYLFEGKAPSVELQGLFQRFRDWLVAIYKNWQSISSEPLSDEVRGVMDRMLATDEQIEEALEARQMQPLFETAEQARVTPEVFERYAQDIRSSRDGAIETQQARSLRDMKYLSNAKSRELQRLQKQAEGLRREVRDEVAGQILDEPIERVRRFLRTGEISIQSYDGRDIFGRFTEKGTPPEEGAVKVTKGHKLNSDILKEMYPEAMLARPDIGRLRNVTSKEGLSPDLVAEMFGFTSGDELVHALIDEIPTRAKIEVETDVRMLEQYGNMVTPEAIERSADQAVHNEARSRVLATEAKVLDAALGRRGLTAAAAKVYAREVASRSVIRDLKPSRYAAAESKLGREAAKALARGDALASANAKRKQMFNHHTAAEAYRVQDEIDRGLRYLRKFDRNLKTLDAEYHDQINSILERFDLRRSVSFRELDRRASLNEWIASQQDQGHDPDIPNYLRNEAARTHYKNLTVEQFRGMVETIIQIEHLGRLKHRLLLNKEGRELGAVKQEIADSIKDNARKSGQAVPTRSDRLSWIKRKVVRFGAGHIRMSVLALVMDGGKDNGAVWRNFVRTANDAENKKVTMNADITQALNEILSPVLKGVPIADRLLKKEDKRLGVSMNWEARFAILLNMGNEGNMQRLLSGGVGAGRSVTLADIEHVLNSFSKAELEAAQAIGDRFEQYRPELAALEKETRGTEPEWVEPRPFTVKTRDGETVALRGWYYPIIYDPALNTTVAQQEEVGNLSAKQKAAQNRATARDSFVKSRSAAVNDRPLLLTLDGMFSGFSDVIHYLCFQRYAIDTGKLLRSKRIQDAIREHHGYEALQQLNSFVSDLVVGQRGINSGAETATSFVRKNIALSRLAFNVNTVLQQPFGIANAVTRLGGGIEGIKWVGRGLVYFANDPVKAVRDTMEASEFVRNRPVTRFRELNEMRNKVRVGGVEDGIAAMGLYAMVRSQLIADVISWRAGYERAVSNDPTISHEDAVAIADQVVKDSQGGGQQVDLSAVERGNAAIKLLTVLFNFQNTGTNLAYLSLKTRRSVARRVSDFIAVFTVPVLVNTLVMSLKPGGDDDDEAIAKQLLVDQLSYLAGTMFMVRETRIAIEAFGDGYNRGYQGPTGLALFTDLSDFAGQIKQGEMDEAFFKSLIRLTGDLTGLPSAQINRAISGGTALADDETDNQAALVFGYQR
jgi:hypothetical protein